MKLKRIAAMLTVAVMAVSLAACGGNTGTNTESSQNPKENAEAQAVHLNLAESWGFEYFYTILTPEVSSSGYDITYYLTSFYDTLFEYNSEGEVVGVLAEDWSMSEDGKTYTFQIKQGVKFSDGSDLTAEDVAKSILAVPVNLGQYNGSYGRLSTIIEDAVATDEYTVELHLTQPYYNTLRELCLANPFGIVSSEQFNEDLTAKQESFRSATYGTGPYMYAGDNDGQTWNFVRNPNYWGEAPEVDSFSIKYIPDNDAKILAIHETKIRRDQTVDAPIVLLDEATASMDAESETLIQDALSVLLKDKTVMVIAHRMRTVANADKIVVLDDGKVSEMGTPAELMKKGGLYAHLVELQQGK